MNKKTAPTAIGAVGAVDVFINKHKFHLKVYQQH